MISAAVAPVESPEAQLARLRAAIPPAELRAADVDAESQVELALELLTRAAAFRGGERKPT